MDFKIGDLIEEWSDFSEGMNEKPTGVIIDILEVLGNKVYHVQLLNSNDCDVIPLYIHEIHKVS